MRQASSDERLRREEEDRRYDQAVVDDPEGPFREYNAGVRRIAADAPSMTHRQVKQELTDLNREHGPGLPASFVDLHSRLISDENFYRHHPLHAAWWMLRFARPGTVQQHWAMLRTGRITLAG
ncbi:hypothetical protein [Nocardioides aurantiacus]|uniref:hypothetical protein n=1 Tax=Nocardioides aurantiacus TaxID=86796 RepID=UPI001FEAB784|nr:hypothetical protein [Nocardioides aurantiacus]